jgi:hypothetical protein
MPVEKSGRVAIPDIPERQASPLEGSLTAVEAGEDDLECA